MRPPRVPCTPEDLQAFAAQPYATHSEVIELERKTFEYWRNIDERLLQRGDFRKVEDHLRREIVYKARFDIYGKGHPERHVIRFPSDWWQAVKERFAPAWFRDRYPVQFTEVSASLEELYPEFEPAIPDRQHVLKVAVRKEPVYPIF